MTWLQALLLGILEGLTEFLPVSSTGHLYLLGVVLGHKDAVAKALEIVMQLGAVVAVVLFYRARIWALLRGLLRRDAASLRLLWTLVLGFVPVVVIGLPFHSKIEDELMAPFPIAGALIAGGVVMVVVERYRRHTVALRLAQGRAGVVPDPGDDGLDKVTPRRALIIGVSQCFSLWPGVSRSMATIVGGQLSGLNTATAADFSFFLSIPTLGSATLFSLYKHRHEILSAPDGAVALAVSTVTSFVVAFVVIAAFLRYLKTHSLSPFGWYRIVLGAFVIVLLLRMARLDHEAGRDTRPVEPAAASAQ